MSVALNDDNAGDEIVVRNWTEASRMFTLMNRRLTAAEAVTRPVHKIWASVKWGGLAAGAALLMGASPASPLGRLVAWFTTDFPQ